MPIRAACLDSGGQYTANAYRFAAQRLRRRVWAIKGRGGAGVKPWPGKPSKGKGGGMVFTIGVDAFKDQLAARLAIAEPGPGHVHFSAELAVEWFDQLTAERKRIRHVNGRPVPEWVPHRDGARNEALDCNVYATAALHGLYAMGLRLNEEAARLAPSEPQPEPGAGAAPRPAVFKSQWIGR